MNARIAGDGKVPADSHIRELYRGKKCAMLRAKNFGWTVKADHLSIDIQVMEMTYCDLDVPTRSDIEKIIELSGLLISDYDKLMDFAEKYSRRTSGFGA